MRRQAPRWGEFYTISAPFAYYLVISGEGGAIPSALSGLFQCCHVCLFLLSVTGLLRPRQSSGE